MKADTYRRASGDVRVVLHLGGHGHSMGLDEAFECARLLLGAIPQAETAENMEKLGIWYLFAGTSPALLVGHKTGTLADAQVEAVDLAKEHRAAIWAMAVKDVSGILAHPPCWVCESMEMRWEDCANRVQVHCSESCAVEVPVGEVPAIGWGELGDLIEEGACVLDDGLY